MKDEFKKITKFTDLVVWQEGHKLVLMIYRITKEFPKDERHGLISQMRRAVVSITSCIAEGFPRKSSKEKAQMFKISQGSLVEIQNQLLVAKDVGYLGKDDFNEIAEQTVKVHRLLNGIIKSANTKKYE